MPRIHRLLSLAALCGLALVAARGESVRAPWMPDRVRATSAAPFAPAQGEALRRVRTMSVRHVRTVSVNGFRLGAQTPNVLAGIQVAVDHRTGLIYASGTLTDHVVEMDPDTGRILRSFRLGFAEFGDHWLRIDSRRRTLFHVAGSGVIRSVDLDAGRQIALANWAPRAPFQREAGRRAESLSDPVVDEATGRLIVINHKAGRVETCDARLHRLACWPVDGEPLRLSLEPRARLAWVMARDSGGQTVMHALHLDSGKRLDGFPLAAFSGQPPRHFARGPGGDFYFVDTALRRVSRDRGPLWSARLPGEPLAPWCLGDRVAVLCRGGQGGLQQDAAYGSVEVIDVRTGRTAASVAVGIDAASAALDPTRGRLIVGNAGDASVSVVDLRLGREIARHPVGASAEQVVVDSGRQTVYVLNRLGGGEVYAYDQLSGHHRTLRAGKWPAAMALDSAHQRLYVLSHYEAKVHVFDTVSKARLNVIDLGLLGCRTDSLAAMSFEQSTGRLYCALPELGYVAVARTREDGPVAHYRPPGLGARRHAGSGQLLAAGDGRGRTFYVFAPASRMVWVFQHDEPLPIAQVSLPFGVDVPAAKGYRLALLYADPVRQRMFVGPCVFDTRQHRLVRVLDRVERVVARDARHLYGNRVDPTGREELCLLDEISLAEVSCAKLFRSRSHRSYVALDPSRRRLYAADMANARVLVFALASQQTQRARRQRRKDPEPDPAFRRRAIWRMLNP